MTSGPTSSGTPRSGPLAGLLVADFSRILAGPYATMLLADLGAEVVKVEGPAGDDTRTWSPPVREGVSTYYLGVNRNKRSIALDLKDPDDAAAAQELARRADVLIENFRPGGLARFGLDYDTVAATNPRIVYASISGFGSGPKGRSLPGYDLIVQAISGPDEPDRRPGGRALPRRHLGLRRDGRAARHHRDPRRAQPPPRDRPRAARRGQPDVVGALRAGQPVAARTSPAAPCPMRMGNSHPSLFPYEPLPCSDGDLIITAGNSGQFRKLVQVLGVPELADDPRFPRNEDRTANRDELRPLLVERLSTRTKDEWFRDIIAAGVPVRPDQHRSTAASPSPRRWASTRSSRSATATRRCRRCATRSRSPRRPADYVLPPPGLDEHGDEIRRWLATRRPGAPMIDDDSSASRPRSAPPTPTRSGCSARTWPPT